MQYLSLTMDSFEFSKMNLMPKPLMLKDYLLHDLSSCSSNGFRTYPRRRRHRQYCSNTTVKYILQDQVDPNKSKPASSAFQRASKTVINAVKLLPFSTLVPFSKRIKSSIFTKRRSRSPEKSSPAKAKESVKDDDEKEQSSPVSVLDFPFNEDDQVSWPFRRKSSTIEEGDLLQKLPEKFKIFNSFYKLEPVDLGEQFAKIEINEELSETCLMECSNEGLFLGCEMQNNRENGGKWEGDREEIVEMIEALILSTLLDELILLLL
ncbi:uncharacterized protein LOC124945179 [Impatiens glandulifera]|uniref:uncharacterized protein LOC124945179 n=1 Tax=Impatiens glandulifera TaxID=253017 RepID=UPI001FB14C9F|nr:uncharacterized protein LOC124945179 [Impatiens glandulifera]